MLSSSATPKIDPQVTADFGDAEFVTYIVKMKEQTDATQVSMFAQQQALKKKISPAAAKLSVRNAVIGSLRETAFKTQGSIESVLSKAKSSGGGVKDYKSFFIVNAIAVTSTKQVMEQLAARPEVASIVPNREYTLDDMKTSEEAASGHAATAEASSSTATVEASSEAETSATDNVAWNIDYVQAPKAWEMGINGTGIVVASIDSGVDYTHPALQRKWRAYQDGMIVHPELSWYDAHSGSPLPEDNDGHGTHTVGTMVGSEENGSNQIGAAPGAKWIAVRTFNPNSSDAIFLAAGQWLLAPTDSNGELHPELAPDVVNNSWGNEMAGKNEFFRPIVQAWRAAGIFPAFAAGNLSMNNPGGPGSVTSPGNYPESFATGATDSNGDIAFFSLLGPSPFGEVKPDVSAPGVGIPSSFPGGEYISADGTSMASPLTAGVAALLLQANHSLTVDQVEEILMNTATPRTDSNYPESPNQAYGAGIINAYEAVRSVLGDAGTGSVSGKVLTDGEDEQAPVIEHQPVPVVYKGREAKLTVQVSDNISVEQVIAYVRSKENDAYTEIPLNRVSGDFKSGRYESALPIQDMNPVAGMEYYITATDYGDNRAESPVYSVEISNGIKPGYLQDFEGDTTGYMTGGQLNTWGIGTPLLGPKGAYSGSKVAASNLNAPYKVGANSFFMTPSIDLTESPEGAILSFKNWYKLLPDIDYGIVYAATENNVYELARFTGQSGGWGSQFIDLRPFAGQRIDLIFNLSVAPYGGLDEGWYIDDLSVQLPDSVPPAVPTGLTGESDAVGNVSLTWEAPADEDVAGYDVYRAIGGGPSEKIGTSKTAAFTDFAAPHDSTAAYQIAAFDFSGNTGELSQTFTVDIPHYTPLFEDKFDGESDNGWTHGGQNDDWARGVPTGIGPANALSSPNVWATNLTGKYANNGNYSLVSPVIDLGQAEHASVMFHHFYEIDDYDYARFEISADGGTTWTQIAAFNGNWNNSNERWEPFSYDLAPYLHQQVQFRFRMETDQGMNFSGWYIDNFRVLDVDAPTASLQAGQTSGGRQLKEPVLAYPELSIAEAAPIGSGLSATAVKAKPEGLPANATVTLLETGLSVTTNRTGAYEFRHVPGNYQLRAEAYGYYPQTKPVTITKDASSVVDFKLEAIPQGRINGIVTDERIKQPVADAVVMVMEDARIAPVRTDANGAFSLDVLEGEYTLSVSSQEHQLKRVSVTVPPDGSVQADIALKPFIGYPNAIGYDDGTGENGYAYYYDGDSYAVRMTPGSENVLVTGAMIQFWDAIWPYPGSDQFEYAVYDASGVAGSPGKLLAGPFPGTGLRNGEWTSVTLPAPVMVHGDFYIVVVQVGDNPNQIGMSVDLDEPLAGRSWQLTEGTWRLFEVGNWMIRALVNDPLDPPVIETPANHDITNKDRVNVEGFAPADSATVNVYNGEELAGTGTTKNGKFSVAASLHPGSNRLTAEFIMNGKTTDRSEPADVVMDITNPSLSVDAPEDGFKTNKEALSLSGTTSDEYFGVLTVNGETAKVNADGTFTHRILLDEGENAVRVTAKDLAGNETTITRMVYLDLNGPNIDHLAPEKDVNLKPGDTLNVSFDSDPGLQATFWIQYPMAVNRAKAGEIAMMESAETPGHYEGSYVLPADSHINGGLIAVRVRDESGNESQAIAAGKLFVASGNSGGGGGGGMVIAPPAPSTDYALAAVIGQGLAKQEVKPVIQTVGTSVTAVISDADLKQALSKAPVAIVVPAAAAASQQSQLRLTAGQAALLAKSNSANAIVFTNGTSAIALPVTAFAKAPANADVFITMGDAAAQSAAFTSAVSGITVIGTPVAFGVSTVTGTTVHPLQLSGKELVKQSFVLANSAKVKAAGALYLADGQANPAPAAFTDNADGTVTVSISRPGYATYAVAAGSTVFQDMDGRAAKAKIAALADRLLIEGTSNTAFSPTVQVTRAQFAAMLTRALGLPNVDGKPFTDVASDKWYADEVGAAYQAGLIQGTGKGMFNPEGLITRQDLAIMLERAAALLRLKLDAVSSHIAFADGADIAGYAKNSVQAVTDGGIIGGTEQGAGLVFRPKAAATREEAAEAMYNLLRLAGIFQ
ncbi:S8 family serine peptidase [Paenibacillus sp. GCM10023250]|uniref:S8 family serine peptidase n=1 Tax=Paenibacillus sp. GCM10023250 TaxID=3252648 RepID=UPI0036184468